jgi:MFS transporter, FSR family, fosmidomycin resistance protein
MSWFAMGGNIGFAVGPVLVALVLGAAGLTGTLPLAVPGLACAAVTVLEPRRVTRANRAAPSRSADVRPADDWAGFAKLTAVVVARSVVTFGLGTYLALFIEHRLGAGLGAGEAAPIIFYAVGAAATILGGRLAGRYGRIRTVRASYLLGVPCLAAIWLVPGLAVYAAVAAAAVALYVPFSLHVTLGQDYLPGRIGTASGDTRGLAVSVGGQATPLLGQIADDASLRTAIAALTIMPVLSALLGITMREPGVGPREEARGVTYQVDRVAPP